MSNTSNEKVGNAKTTVRCHYDVLGVERDADSSTIKKSYRRKAIQYHPDKNVSKTDVEIEEAAEQFRLIQQAYEVLSDPQEKAWYDDHRDAILSGWKSGGDNDGDDLAAKMLFKVGPFMNPSCYSSYDNNDKNGFWRVYNQVFEGIVSCEMNQSDVMIDLPTKFGNNDSPWEDVKYFYQSWESFSSALNFAWEDTFNANEDGQSRWVRRRMEEENKRERKAAKKEYNNDIITLVAFVKRRDPRIKARQIEREKQKALDEAKRKQDAIDRKKEQQKAKEIWKEEARREQEAAEEQDRLAGRVRLADLEDDYDYGSGKKSKKKKGKGKKNKRNNTNIDDDYDDMAGIVSDEVQAAQGAMETVSNDMSENPDTSIVDEEGSRVEDPDVQDQPDSTNDPAVVTDGVESTLQDDAKLSHTRQDDDGEYTDDEEEEEEPDSWRCDVCRKDFKSEAQLENHLKSKKHKEAYKKFLKKVKQKEDEIMAEMMDDMDLQR